MQALVKHSHTSLDVTVTNRPRPAPGPGQALVRTEAVGLCGSDVHAWRQDPGYEWVAPPVTLGHEAVGIVEEVADDVDPSWQGRRVVPISIDGCGGCRVCAGGQRQICPRRTVLGLSFDGAAAEAFVVDAQRLVSVDPRLPASTLALTEPLAIAVHAVALLTTQVESTPVDVVVTGPGPIGLMAATLLHDQGHRVTVAGTAQDRTVRLKLAADLGLPTCEGDDLPVDPPLWLEASGAGAALATAVTRTAVGGTIVIPALFARTPTVDVNLITRRELNVRGSYGATRTDYESAAAHIVRAPERWARFVSDFPLADATSALERISQGDVNKAVLLP